MKSTLAFAMGCEIIATARVRIVKLMDDLKLRLKQFSVDGLFGLFHHIVPLNLSERITLIHAPNGFGKTIILRLISGFFGGSLAVFSEIEYGRVTLLFDDESRVEIEQEGIQRELLPRNSRSKRRPYTISYFQNSDTLVYNPDDRPSDGRLAGVAPSAWERALPFLIRVGENEWRDQIVGDLIDSAELAHRYWDRLPAAARRPSRIPEWLDTVRKSVHCRFIDTQRLFGLERGEYARSEPVMTPSVKTYSTELAVTIERLLASSATFSQSLDQSFPNKVIQRMRESRLPPTESELRSRLAELNSKRERLARVGLLNSADQGEFSSHQAFDNPTRRILAEYVTDTSRKLNIYNELLAKLELFVEILTSRFQYKSISIDRQEGFVFRDDAKRKLAPESLSSGEQHELVLLFDLLFKTNNNTLILIDEPELSLHIAWEKRFLQDLDRIISLTGIDAVLCTHSPQIIGSRLNLAVQLRAPKNGQLDH